MPLTTQACLGSGLTLGSNRITASLHQPSVPLMAGSSGHRALPQAAGFLSIGCRASESLLHMAGKPHLACTSTDLEGLKALIYLCST